MRFVLTRHLLHPPPLYTPRNFFSFKYYAITIHPSTKNLFLIHLSWHPNLRICYMTYFQSQSYYIPLNLIYDKSMHTKTFYSLKPYHNCDMTMHLQTLKSPWIGIQKECASVFQMLKFHVPLSLLEFTSRFFPTMPIWNCIVLPPKTRWNKTWKAFIGPLYDAKMQSRSWKKLSVKF